MEPVLELQNAILAILEDAPEVTALVDPINIRAGSTRPDEKPCIIVGDGNTARSGHDYAAQRTARVVMDLHIWTLGSGQNAAKEITGKVAAALDVRKLDIQGGFCDDFRVVATRFPRDPNPDYGHGVLSIEAAVRWII